MDTKLQQIRDMREFNRFYTGILGLLDRHILSSDFSLAEARILYELNAQGSCTANTLSEKLQVDKSYMSRIVSRFASEGLISRHLSSGDKRAQILRLTQRGKEAAEYLNQESERQIEKILAPLNETERNEVHIAMLLVKRRLMQATMQITLRLFQSTRLDEDYMTARQLRLYELEYMLSSDVWKAYVTDGVHQLIAQLSSGENGAWILEANGVPSGCIAIAHAGENRAQLRFFFVESDLRGLGYGNRLMEAALNFCREKAYQSVFLWTFSRLSAARHLYAKFGFQIAATHENSEWGIPVTEERWELTLP